MADDRQYHLKISGEAAAGVDAYLEYRRIVGDDDGGVMFTPEQYEEYKKKVLPMRLKNRLFTAWTNPNGMDCKLIGPETPCFCQHRYKQHKTDFETLPSVRPILLPCRVSGCQCASYHYVPLLGSTPIRCNCKHTADEHSVVAPYQCKKSICQKCAGFKSSYTCGCGEPYNNHQMIVETKEEREARGHPIGMDVPYQAMGGITGFSSLAEGYARLDPSGRGAMQEEELSREITSTDNPFLRANVASIQAHRKAVKGPGYDRLDEDMAERLSAMRRPGESELDYYERRYQERQRKERLANFAPPQKEVEYPSAGPSRAGQVKPKVSVGGTNQRASMPAQSSLTAAAPTGARKASATTGQKPSSAKPSNAKPSSAKPAPPK